jgi:hypothetical protein
MSNTDTTTRTARHLVVGDTLADGARIAEISPSVREPGHLTFLLAEHGQCSALVVSPDTELEVQW